MANTLFSGNQDDGSKAMPLGQWLAFVCLGLAIPNILIVALNYQHDPFAVFHPDRELSMIQNASFGKFEHLRKNLEENDPVLFGSSRANALDARAVLTDNAYVFSAAGATYHLHYLRLKKLLEMGHQAKTFIFVIGEAAYQAPKNLRDVKNVEHLIIKPHPLVSGESLPRFYWRYLWRLPTRNDIVYFSLALSEVVRRALGWADKAEDQLTAAEKEVRANPHRYRIDGRLHSSERERYIDANPEMRSKLLKRIMFNKNEYGVENAIEDFANVAALAEKYDVKVLFVMDALYRGRYLRLDIDELNRLKKGISEFTEFLDFGNFRPEFAEERNFLDSIHYTEAVGAVLLSDMQRALRGDTTHLSLGRWVTKANIDKHLSDLKLRQAQLREETGFGG